MTVYNLTSQGIRLLTEQSLTQLHVASALNDVKLYRDGKRKCMWWDHSILVWVASFYACAIPMAHPYITFSLHFETVS